MDINQAAEKITSAWKTRGQIPPLSQNITSLDLPAGYVVQDAVVSQHLNGGAIISGGKIGLADPRSFQAMGVTEPVSGLLFDHMQLSSGAVLSPSQYRMPRVEGELCMTLSADLDDPDLSVETVKDAIGSVAPAIEIVDSRWTNWSGTIADIIAENISASFYVCGDPVDDPDMTAMETCVMHMTIDSALVSSGEAGAVFGSPIRALHWLARDLARRGWPLREGHQVMSGAFARMCPATAGQHVGVNFPGIGQVDVTFADS